METDTSQDCDSERDRPGLKPAAKLGLLARMTGFFSDRSHSVRDSIEDALDETGAAADVLSPKERVMLRNVLDLRDLRVEDVMVPRADIVAVDTNDSVEAIVHVFHAGGHSRLPVYRETLDDPLGMIHIKDVLAYITSQAAAQKEAAGSRSKSSAPEGLAQLDLDRVDLSVSAGKIKLLRDVLYVPPSMPVGDLLLKMQTTRIHMALVVDEYGGTDGLVTIEDLVEAIVGDIQDEHDERNGPPIVAAGNDIFVADARASLADLHIALGKKVVSDEILEEIDTIGGLIFHRAGRVPVRGELVEIVSGLEFEILDADPRRIKRVKIHRRPAADTRKTRRPRRKTDSETADSLETSA